MTTHYKGSKGSVEIASMNGKHAATAAAKLRREAPDRIAEIEALEVHAARMAEEHATATIGDNGGPALEPDAPKVGTWDAIKAHLDDLLTEAGNWADGVNVVSQEQADTIGRLRQQLQQAITAADAARVEEKRPLDEQIAAIQDRYNAYIAPLKNKHPGSASKAVAALGNLLTAWLNKLDDERRERERAAAKAAAVAAAEALAARAEAKQATDLTAMDRADDMLAEAEALLKQAKGVSSEKVQAQGETRAIGLRSYWTAEMIEGGGADALRHYLKTKPDRVKAFLQSLADEDVRNGLRAVPGFTITEIKKVA